MPVPSPLPLEAFEHAIQTDPQILGVFYYGSLGRGTATTTASDLDISIWFSAEVPEPADATLQQLLGTFGSIGWMDLNEGRAFIGPDWVQVDVTPKYGEQVWEPWEGFAGGTVIKDTEDGELSRLVAASTVAVPAETVASARPIISEAIGDQLFLARHNARGSVWSATGTITDLAKSTYELLGRLRGTRTYGFRAVEDLLTLEEQALLVAAWPRDATQAENRRAARALWDWTTFVWGEAERVIGEPLDLAVDEAALLAAIDRLYR
jgi:hypothetical protein